MCEITYRLYGRSYTRTPNLVFTSGRSKAKLETVAYAVFTAASLNLINAGILVLLSSRDLLRVLDFPGASLSQGSSAGGDIFEIMWNP